MNNGREAVEAVASDSFDCILMDLHMPEMNGIDATIEIRRNSNTKISGIPIIALTAAAYKEDKENMLAAGMNDYLSKPINEDALLKVLKCFDTESPATNILHTSNLVQETIMMDPVKNSTGTINVLAEQVINIQGFNKNFGSFAVETLNEIIDEFIDGHNKKLNKIQEYIQVKDLNSLMHEAHSLKGEVTMFCAESVKKALSVIEDKARNKITDDLQYDFEIASQYVKKLSEELMEMRKK